VPDALRGGYIRVPGDDAVVIASGSEVPLAEDAAALLAASGHSVRVVSMPCVEAFERQSADYRESVVGSSLPVFTLEAGVTFGWSAHVGNGGVSIGIDRFGASAPAEVLAEKFGFTPASVATTVRSALGG
jgi:transketolase